MTSNVVEVKQEQLNTTAGERRARMNNMKASGDARSTAPQVNVFTDDGTVNQAVVCVDFLNEKCKIQNGVCPAGHLHSQRPYQWQVKDSGAANGVWYNFP